MRSSVYLLTNWVKNTLSNEKNHQLSLRREEPDGLRLCTNIRRSHFTSENVPSTQISVPESSLSGKNTSQIPIVPLRRPTAEKRMKCRDSWAPFILLGFSARMSQPLLICGQNVVWLEGRVGNGCGRVPIGWMFTYISCVLLCVEPIGSCTIRFPIWTK